MKKTEILIAQPDYSIAAKVSHSLWKALSFHSQIFLNGKDAWMSFQAFNNFKVCIINTSLPVKNGFELAQDIRSLDEVIPIIFLTSHGHIDTIRISAYQHGGDCILDTPCNADILIEYIKVFLKRSQPQAVVQDTYNLSGFTFSYKTLTLSLEDEVLQTFSQRQADILQLLAQYQDKAVTREELLKNIWRKVNYANGRSMDALICKLRKKLAEFKSINIETVPCLGFRLSCKNNVQNVLPLSATG